MRDLRLVSADEFNAFVAASPALETKQVGQTLHYLDNADGQQWPDNIVASYIPASETRKRSSGWRISGSAG